MMRRRAFLLGAGVALAAPSISRAQHARQRRIGYLSMNALSSVAAFIRAFAEGLRDLGWIEGENIVVERRFAEGHYERLPGLAAELVRSKVELLVAAGPNPIIRAAQQATADIPIVMVIAVDPVRQGFVSSLARPGGNITGLAWDQTPDISGKFPELLKTAVPGLSKLGGLIDVTFEGIGTYRQASEEAAAKLGLAFHHAEIRRADDLDQAFTELASWGAQAVQVYGSALILQNARRIVALAAKHRMADMYIFREAVQMNGLMSYGVNTVDLYRRAPAYVDKILKGSRPADLPVQLPTKYELVINRKTAKTLGLALPSSLLLRADEVID